MTKTEKFRLGGKQRYAHQRRGLKKLIETRGVAALLFDPGLGKSATTLDYLSLLAYKNTQLGPDGVPEIKVLMVSPKAAVDNWVIQAEEWCSPDIAVWAEAIGGSIKKKAETMAHRAGQTLKARASGTPAKRYGDRMIHSQISELSYGRRSENEGGQRVQKISDLGKAPRLIIISTNLDTFSSRGRYGSGTMADLLMSAVRKMQPHVVVVDEMHKLKSPTSNVSRLLSRIGEIVPRRIGLTGTVLPHSPLDVFAQWRFIEPYAFGGFDSRGQKKKATWGGFQDRYAVKGGYMGREIKRFKNLDNMQEIMSKNSVAARKKDSLDLPKTTPVEVPVDLSPAERRAYEDMKQSLVAQLLGSSAKATAPNRLTQLMRLRQITAGFVKTDTGEERDLGNSKGQVIKSIVQDTLTDEKRIVIFALFRREIEELEKLLQEKGTDVLVIDGRTPDETRLKYRRRFGSSDPSRIVLIAQISTISLSVNELVTASHAIFATLSQKRDDLIQAQDRLNRIGQKLPVTFWYAIVKGSVDEVILESHRKRTNLENAVLEHIKNT